MSALTGWHGVIEPVVKIEKGDWGHGITRRVWLRCGHGLNGNAQWEPAVGFGVYCPSCSDSEGRRILPPGVDGLKLLAEVRALCGEVVGGRGAGADARDLARRIGRLLDEPPQRGGGDGA